MKKGNFTFFWNGIYSQWFPCEFTDPKIPDIVFNCAEQYMMYQKALLMKDNDTAKKILETKHPKDQKALGRQIKNFDGKLWDKYKEFIVYRGNQLKFTQNPYLLEQLKLTNPTILVEASPYDRIWGIGLAEDDSRAMMEAQWLGLNLLGKALTNLRNNLLKHEAEIDGTRKN